MPNTLALTESVLAVLRRSLEDGMSVAEAAKKAGVSTTSAYRAVKNQGLTLPGRPAAAPRQPAVRPPSPGDRTRAAVLAKVRDQILFTGRPPTQREIATALGLAPATVAYQMGQLAKRGLLASGDNRTRGTALRGRAFWDALDEVERQAQLLNPTETPYRLLMALCIPFRRPRRTNWTMPGEGVEVMMEHLHLRLGRPVMESEIAASTGLSSDVVSTALNHLVARGAAERCEPGVRPTGPSPVARVVFMFRRAGTVSSMPTAAQEPLRVMLAALDAV